jgi:hypothetical protein
VPPSSPDSGVYPGEHAPPLSSLRPRRVVVLMLVLAVPWCFLSTFYTGHTGGKSQQSRMVRQIFDWVGQERLSMGEVSCRLMPAGIRTRAGKTHWELIVCARSGASRH